MAGSTVDGFTWTDDSGTPASPAGDGTTINNTQLQSIFSEINKLFSGAGSFTTLTCGGLFATEGGGQNTFNGTGDANGLQGVAARNTGANTDDAGIVHVGNNSDADLGRLEAYSSAYTDTAYAPLSAANRVGLRAMGANGLVLSAENASGDVILAANGTTKLATFDGDVLAFSGGNTTYKSGGLFASVLTTDGTPANTTETVLHTITIPGNSLNANGRGVRISGGGSFAANTNAKTVRIRIGGISGTVIVTFTDSSGQADHIAWQYDCLIFRDASGSQKCLGLAQGQDTGDMTMTKGNIGYADGAETDTADIDVVITGENGTASANDIEAKISCGVFLP